MPMHNQHESFRNQESPQPYPNCEHGPSKRVSPRSGRIVILLTAVGIVVLVAAELFYGVGRAVRAGALKDDSPDSKTIEVRQLDTAPASPELHRKLAELNQPLPAPLVKTDESNQQDVADLHAREDLLLENYTWTDRAQGKVRIPIQRAMELIAQSGLPTAPKVQHAPLLAHDSLPVVVRPITNGFARTGFEQEQALTQKIAKREQP